MTQAARSAALHSAEVLLLVGFAVVLPMIIHQVPAVGGAPWGARLLAMFVAPFVGLFLFGFRIAIIPAMVAPFLNNALFGGPADALVGLVTVELGVFTVAAALLLRFDRRFWLTAPVAILVAKVASALLLAFTALFNLPVTASDFLVGSIVVSLPGVVVLVIVHVLMVRGEGLEQG